MRAVVTTDPGGPLTVADVEDPTPGPGEVVLAVEACGICGSDLHLVDVWPIPGQVLGHELSGRVVALGEGVDGVAEGDAVVGLSLATCGVCDACRSGRPRKCVTARMVGIDTPGAYAEYTTLPAHDAVAFPEGVDLALGALVEPLAIARHAVGRAGLRPGETSLVVGAGPIGLASLLWLRRLGAGPVVLSDPDPRRRATAADLGADLVVDPTAGDLATQVADAGLGAVPLVLECVGLPGLVAQASAAAAVDGRVVVVGVCMGEDRYDPLAPLGKELDWRFSFYYCRADIDASIGAVTDPAFGAADLVTGLVGIEATPDRFAALKAGGTDDVKVLIRP